MNRGAVANTRWVNRVAVANTRRVNKLGSCSTPRARIVTQSKSMIIAMVWNEPRLSQDDLDRPPRGVICAQIIHMGASHGTPGTPRGVSRITKNMAMIIAMFWNEPGMPNGRSRVNPRSREADRVHWEHRSPRSNVGPP